MTVYVDDMQIRARVGGLNAVWSHLIADTEEELHAFAARLGLHRSWYQGDHYDVTDTKRTLAIKLGAKAITAEEAGRMAAARRRRLSHPYGWINIYTDRLALTFCTWFCLAAWLSGKDPDDARKIVRMALRRS